jgi:hypothetical protein
MIIRQRLGSEEELAAGTPISGGYLAVVRRAVTLLEFDFWSCHLLYDYTTVPSK